MQVERIIYEKTELNITGVTLLSVDEAKKLPLDILKSSSDWWWLSSQGDDASHAACVFGDDGSVSDYGVLVSSGLGVRPALKIENLELSTFEIGDRFKFKNHNFTIISNEHALSDDSIRYSAFRENWRAEDANVYEASDIKRYIEEWMTES